MNKGTLALCLAGLTSGLSAMGGGEPSQAIHHYHPQSAPLERNEPSFTGFVTDEKVSGGVKKTPVVDIAFSSPTPDNRPPRNASTRQRGLRDLEDDSHNAIDLAKVQSIEVVNRRYIDPRDKQDYVHSAIIFQSGTARNELLFPFDTVISAVEVAEPVTPDSRELPKRTLEKAWWLRDLHRIDILGTAGRMPKRR